MVGLLPYRQMAKAQDFDSCIGGSNPSGAVGISQLMLSFFISSFRLLCAVNTSFQDRLCQDERFLTFLRLLGSFSTT